MRLVLAGLAATLLGPASASTTAPAQCVMPAEGARWIGDSLKAWTLVRRDKLKLTDPFRPTIILFDAQCTYVARPGPTLRWIGTPHGETVPLPNGDAIPPTVTSFTKSDDKTGNLFFVMALPSVWRAANKQGKHGLETLLTFVFLHEYSHTRQAVAVGAFFDTLAARYPLSEGFDDDSLQARFGSDPAYVAAYENERDLLYAAAAEPSRGKAKAIAAQALKAMRARQARWFTGADAMWRPVDDMFLTLEGVGQWAGYSWLADPHGRGLGAADAIDDARGSRKWWSQEEGLALLLVIDRLLPGWQRKIFAPQPATGIDLLAEAVGAAN